MSKTGIVIFILIAVLLIWVGVRYNRVIDEKAQGDLVAQQEKIQKERDMILEKLVKADIVVGTGGEAKSGDMARVHYVGTLEDGAKFDSSYDHGQPFEFIVGAGQVIQGWDLGIVGMKVGGKRSLTIPPELAYGSDGRGPILPNATLKFVIELLAVNPKGSALGN